VQLSIEKFTTLETILQIPPYLKVFRQAPSCVKLEFEAGNKRVSLYPFFHHAPSLPNHVAPAFCKIARAGLSEFRFLIVFS